MRNLPRIPAIPDWLPVKGSRCRWATCPAYGKTVHDPDAHQHHSEVQ